MHKHTDATRGRYLEKIVDLMDRGELPKVGVYQADVYHDSWCKHWTGGACDCEPIVKIRGQYGQRSGHS